MSDSRSFASLSSSLLARKGEARPAMRPQALQLQNNSQASHAILDDLGWNDMGHDLPTDAFAPEAPSALPGVEALPSAGLPPVVQQQDALANHFEPDANLQADLPAADIPPLSGFSPGFVSRTKPASTEPVARAVPGARGKSAFTLRLDAGRHLHLRLVCAVHHRSAQQIVTQALDEFLARQPSPAELTSRANG
jgi:hypothetical protein